MNKKILGNIVKVTEHHVTVAVTSIIYNSFYKKHTKRIKKFRVKKLNSEGAYKKGNELRFQFTRSLSKDVFCIEVQ